MKNKKALQYLLFGITIALIVIPIIINCLYIPNGKIITAWDAGDILQYLGATLTGIATIIIAWIAIKQSDNSFQLEKRMKELELNEYSPKLSVCGFVGNAMAYTPHSQNGQGTNCFIAKLTFEEHEDSYYGLGFIFQDDNLDTSKTTFVNQYRFLFEYSSKLFVNGVFLESIRFLKNDMQPIYSLENLNCDMETSLFIEQKVALLLSFAGNDLPSINDSYLSLLSKASKIEIKLRFKVDAKTDYMGTVMIRKLLDDDTEQCVTWTFSIEE